MANCILTFNTPNGTLLSVDSGLQAEDFSNILKSLFKDSHLLDIFGNEYKGQNGQLSEYDLFAEVLIKNLNPGIVNKLVDTYHSDTTLTYNNLEAVVPNKTASQLMEEYPNLEIAENTPDIVLVDSDTKITTPYIKAIKLENGKYSYIVPKNKVYAFGYFSYRLRAVEDLINEGLSEIEINNSEKYSKYNLNELKEAIQLGYNNKDNSSKISAQSKISAHIVSEKNAFIKERADLIQEKIKLQARIQKKSKETHKENTKAAVETKTAIEKAELRIEEIDNRVSEIDKHIEEINNDTFTDKTIEDIKNKSKAVVNTKLDLNKHIAEILKDYIHNELKFQEFLNPEIIIKIETVLGQMSDKQKFKDYHNDYINGFLGLIEKTSPGKYRVSKKAIFDYFQRSKLIKASDTFKNFDKQKLLEMFEDLFLDHVDNYMLDTPTNINYFSLKASPRLLIYDSFKDTLNVKEFMMTEALKHNYTRYKGYYIYNIQKNGVSTWYFSDRFLNEYSNPKPYESKAKVLEEIDRITNNSKLIKNKLYIPIEEGIHSLTLPTKLSIKKGELLSTINYERGPYVANLTNKEFDNWFDATFLALRDEVRIKNLLDSTEKKALFYSHFGNINLNTINDEVLNRARVVLNAILNNEIYFYALDDAYNEYGTYHVNGLVLKYEDIITPKVVGKSNLFGFDQLVLTSFVHSLNSAGIPTKLLNQEDFNEVLKEKGLDPNEHINAKGAYSQGIIYINQEKATAETPIHEFTHILLSVLKSNNPTVYEAILNNVMETPEGKKMLEDVRKRYKTVSNETDLKEEAFADLYADYIVGKSNKTLNDFFNLTETNIGNITSIFESGEFSTKGDASIGNIFSKFSKQIKYGLKHIGFGLPLNERGYNAAVKFYEKNHLTVTSKDDVSDKAIKEVCK